MMTAEDGEVIFALLSDGVVHKSKSSSLCSWKAATIIVMSFTVGIAIGMPYPILGEMCVMVQADSMAGVTSVYAVRALGFVIGTTTASFSSQTLTLPKFAAGSLLMTGVVTAIVPWTNNLYTLDGVIFIQGAFIGMMQRGIYMQGEVYLQPTSVSCALGAMTASLISVPFLSDVSSLSSNDDSVLSVNSRYRRAGEGVDYLGTEFKIADVTTPLPMIGNIANNGIAKTIMPTFTNTTPLLVDDVVNEFIDSPKNYKIFASNYSSTTSVPSSTTTEPSSTTPVIHKKPGLTGETVPKNSDNDGSQLAHNIRPFVGDVVSESKDTHIYNETFAGNYSSTTVEPSSASTESSSTTPVIHKKPGLTGETLPKNSDNDGSQLAHNIRPFVGDVVSESKDTHIYNETFAGNYSSTTVEPSSASTESSSTTPVIHKKPGLTGETVPKNSDNDGSQLAHNIRPFVGDVVSESKDTHIYNETFAGNYSSTTVEPSSASTESSSTTPVIHKKPGLTGETLPKNSDNDGSQLAHNIRSFVGDVVSESKDTHIYNETFAGNYSSTTVEPSSASTESSSTTPVIHKKPGLTGETLPKNSDNDGSQLVYNIQIRYQFAASEHRDDIKTTTTTTVSSPVSVANNTDRFNQTSDDTTESTASSKLDTDIPMSITGKPGKDELINGSAQQTVDGSTTAAPPSTLSSKPPASLSSTTFSKLLFKPNANSTTPSKLLPISPTTSTISLSPTKPPTSVLPHNQRSTRTMQPSQDQEPEPMLLKDEVLGHNETSPVDTQLPDYDAVTSVCVIIGVICVVCAVLAFVTETCCLCEGNRLAWSFVSSNKIPVKSASDLSDVSSSPSIVFVVLTLLFAMEVTFGSLIATHMQTQLQWSGGKAALAAAVFWCSLAVSLHLTSLVSCCGGVLMSCVGLVLCCSCMAGMFVVSLYPSLVWFYVGGIGAGIAVCLQQTVSIHAAAIQSSTFIIFSSPVAELVFPAAVGLAMDRLTKSSVPVLICAVFVMAVLCLIVIIVAAKLASKNQPLRYSRLATVESSVAEELLTESMPEFEEHSNDLQHQEQKH